jgi:hypothetical protein
MGKDYVPSRSTALTEGNNGDLCTSAAFIGSNLAYARMVASFETFSIWNNS